MGLAMVAGGLCMAQLLGGGHWRPRLLAALAVLYLLFTIHAWRA
jgi:hypothetical protein